MKSVVGLAILLSACGGKTKTTDVANHTDTAGKASAPTVEMMEAFGAGTQHLSDYVDAKRGVVFVDGSVNPGEDVAEENGEPAPPPKDPDGLRCGDKLTELITNTQKSLEGPDGDIAMAKAEDRLHCAGMMCTIAAPMEWSPAIHFVFAADATRGIVLRGLALNDEAAVAPEAVDQAVAEQTKQIEQLAAGTCP